MTTYKKDPDALLDFRFDWTAWLAPIVDTIASVAWEVSAGLTLGTVSNTTLVATAFVSGGIEGETEVLTCRITTTGGRIDDRSVNLKILER